MTGPDGRREALRTLRSLRLVHDLRKVVPAVGELLDDHLPVAHVDVLDDQLAAEDAPPGQVHEDALGLEERAIGGLQPLDDQVVDFERSGQRAPPSGRRCASGVRDTSIRPSRRACAARDRDRSSAWRPGRRPRAPRGARARAARGGDDGASAAARQVPARARPPAAPVEAGVLRAPTRSRPARRRPRRRAPRSRSRA